MQHTAHLDQPSCRRSQGQAGPNLTQVLAQPEPQLSQLQRAVKAQECPRPGQPVKPQMSNVDKQVQQLWQTSKTEKPPRTQMLRSFRAFRALTEQKQRHRELRKLARQRKQQQIMDSLSLAEQAAMQHGTRTQYKYIRMLAPKSFHRRICLRTDSGGLMSLDEEADVLLDYAKQLFRGSEWEPPPLQSRNPEWFTAAAWPGTRHSSN